MVMNKAYQHHLNVSEDLITTHEATRAGFIRFALEKNRKATPFIEEARALRIMASKAKTPAMLAEIGDIQPALLTASGVSDKAVKYIKKEEAVQELIPLEPMNIGKLHEQPFLELKPLLQKRSFVRMFSLLERQSRKL